MTAPWLPLLGRVPRPVLLIAALALFPQFSPATSVASVVTAAGAQSLNIDPSVRAAGMGRASSAVFWGDAPNAWSNPALISYNQGVRYDWGRTQLVPELADDVHFTTKRLTASYWGIGLQLAGKPVDGLGGSRLDYGNAIATDVNGDPIGSYDSHEDIEAFAGAVSILDLADHVSAALCREGTHLSRFGDVSLGWSEKKTHVFLAPALVTLDGLAGEGTTTTHDSGILFRLTPYNSIDYRGCLPGLDRLAGIRVDVAHARSTLNYDDATISYIDEDQADPVLRTHRTGWVAHVALGFSTDTRDALKSKRLGWLPKFISPLVQWGKAWDRETPMILDPSTGYHVRGSEIEDTGWELTFANIYSIRRGRINDPDGTIIGSTKGWSLGLRLKDLAGFSYDHATVPQSIFLGPVQRKAFTFFIDPVRLWAQLRS